MCVGCVIVTGCITAYVYWLCAEQQTSSPHCVGCAAGGQCSQVDYCTFSACSAQQTWQPCRTQDGKHRWKRWLLCLLLQVCCSVAAICLCLVLSLCAVSLCWLLRVFGSVPAGKHVTVTLPINQPTPIPLLCVHSRLLARPADWQVHYCNRPIQWQHVMKPGEYSDGIRSCNSLEGHGVYRSVTGSPSLISNLTSAQIKTERVWISELRSCVTVKVAILAPHP